MKKFLHKIWRAITFVPRYAVNLTVDCWKEDPIVGLAVGACWAIMLADIIYVSVVAGVAMGAVYTLFLGLVFCISYAFFWSLQTMFAPAPVMAPAWNHTFVVKAV